ncbi:MAG: glycosyltransferase [Clostridia bacterium]|nr:glycosyltransferase [Clostridia bacterium]
MKDKLHVLVIPTWYPIGEDKLMGVYHKDFTCALNKRDDCYGNILYIQRYRLKKPLDYLKAKKWKVIDEGNYHTYIRCMLNLGPISKTLQLDQYTKMLDKAFQRYVKEHGKPDILHAKVIVPAGYAAAKLSVKYNIPLIITEHTSDTARARLTKEPYMPYAKYALEHSLYTAVSQNVIDIIGDAAEGIRILPNSVDLSIFNDDRKKTPDGKIEMVTVCALRSEKGIDYEAFALKLLREEYGYDNLHLTVVGDGDYAGFYKEKVKEAGVQDIVTFVGKKTREEVKEYLTASDFMVMPSIEETFGIPPIEAMACGIPVVSTRCGAPEEYMTEQCGELCNVRDPEDLARAIDRVIKKIGEYDTSYLKSVANTFSEKAVTDKAMEFYRELLTQ